MYKLIIKTKDDKTYSACLPIHSMVAELYNIDFNDIIAVGFIIKEEEVWESRKPH